MTTFFDLKAKDVQGNEKSMSDYRGNVLLVVNVASKCGLTPQYKGIEELYKKYQDRGFKVVAFPCNDFGAQEPGTLEEIQQFCSINYGVTFDLMDKVHCLGADQHPIYQWLTGQTADQGDIQWNFEKFLISRDGQIIQRFSPKVAPEDEALVAAIEKAL